MLCVVHIFFSGWSTESALRQDVLYRQMLCLQSIPNCPYAKWTCFSTFLAYSGPYSWFYIPPKMTEHMIRSINSWNPNDPCFDGKDLVWEGSTTKIEDKQVPGLHYLNHSGQKIPLPIFLLTQTSDLVGLRTSWTGQPDWVLDP